MLVENRMNSLYLWNGHPFASLVKLEEYPFAVEEMCIRDRLYGDVHIGRAAVGHDETASGYAGYHAVSIGGGVNLSQ